MFIAAIISASNLRSKYSVSIFQSIFWTEFLKLFLCDTFSKMGDVELKARKAAVDFVNANFTDLESLDRVKDIYDDVYRTHETCRQQLDDQVMLGFEVQCQNQNWPAR